MVARALPVLLLFASLAIAEDDLTAYSAEEIEGLLETFKQTYKDKRAPEEDAVSTLANLKKAYRYLDSKGDQATKDELKLKSRIVALIAKKGLFVRKRPLVTIECARILGELGDPAGAPELRKWLVKVLDEKSPHAQWVEYGFQSLAWIGSQDSRILDLILDHATKGKHRDIGVAAHALKACYQYKHLDKKMRMEFFKKINGYLGGLYSNMRGGDAKKRATYEQRYNAIREDGLAALRELAGDGTVFKDPAQAQAWWNDNKKRKWEPYTGPRFRDKTKKASGKGA